MGKPSFIIHIDSLDVIDELTNEQAGELFRAIKAHQKNEEIDISGIVKIAFSPFKNQFIRDDKKYEKTCESRRKAGSKGGKQKVANATNCKQNVANLAESKNKNKNKKESKSKNEEQETCIASLRIIEMFNQFIPDLPKIIKLTDKRKGQLKKLSKDIQTEKEWFLFFQKINESDFLMGRKTDWSANFDWIINPANSIKIMEGNYDNKSDFDDNQW